MGKGKSYVNRITRELNPPSKMICMQVVQGNPVISKPCDNLFFNYSLISLLITAWGIAAFVSLTALLYYIRYHFKHPKPTQIIYKMKNRHRQLLMQTEDKEEALRFISRGYQIESTACEQNITWVGIKTVVSNSIVYLVRGNDKTERTRSYRR